MFTSQKKPNIPQSNFPSQNFRFVLLGWCGPSMNWSMKLLTR